MGLHSKMRAYRHWSMCGILSITVGCLLLPVSTYADAEAAIDRPGRAGSKPGGGANSSADKQQAARQRVVDDAHRIQSQTDSAQRAVGDSFDQLRRRVEAAGGSPRDSSDGESDDSQTSINSQRPTSSPDRLTQLQNDLESFHSETLQMLQSGQNSDGLTGRTQAVLQDSGGQPQGVIEQFKAELKTITSSSDIGSYVEDGANSAWNDVVSAATPFYREALDVATATGRVLTNEVLDQVKAGKDVSLKDAAGDGIHNVLKETAADALNSLIDVAPPGKQIDYRAAKSIFPGTDGTNELLDHNVLKPLDHVNTQLDPTLDLIDSH